MLTKITHALLFAGALFVGASLAVQADTARMQNIVVSTTTGNILKVTGTSSGGTTDSYGADVIDGGTKRMTLATDDPVSTTAVIWSGTLKADDADFTDGSSVGVPIMAVAESASPSTVTEGDFGIPAMTLNRAQKVTLYNSSGTELTALDPCQNNVKSRALIDVAAAQTTEIIDEVAGKKIYLCSLYLSSHGTNTVALVEDTVDACGGTEAAMFGGATAAEGISLVAQSGAFGNGGYTWTQTSATDMNVCLITSGTAQLSGVVMYVAQ